MSAFKPEIVNLRESTDIENIYTINGVEFITGVLEGQNVVLFLSGISVVNAAMTTQLALDHFNVDRIIFSGIAGGVDPDLNIGDVVITDRWAQYLEVLLARQAEDGWQTIDFFDYPYPNFGMIFPRSVTVRRAGSSEPETRFWFPVDESLLANARAAVRNIALDDCTPDGACMDEAPKIIVGGPGVSGGAYVDNAEFRQYTYETFGAKVLDMESSAVAHVAYANDVPFIAVRSLSDLAGGGETDENQINVFFQLASENAARVVKALLRQIPK